MLVEIEGLIGVGKSTLAENLYGIHYFEPVETNVFLQDYYKNPQRWAYAMQVNLMCERYKTLQCAQYQSLMGEDVILDRSFYGDYAFALVQKVEGLFTDAEFKSYENIFNMHLPQLMLPDIIIWLEASVDTIISRINKRNRGCESGIQREYLEDLKQAYNDVLNVLERYTTVIRIDAERDASQVLSDVQNAIFTHRQKCFHRPALSLHLGETYKK